MEFWALDLGVWGSGFGGEDGDQPLVNVELVGSSGFRGGDTDQPLVDAELGAAKCRFDARGLEFWVSIVEFGGSGFGAEDGDQPLVNAELGAAVLTPGL